MKSFKLPQSVLVVIFSRDLDVLLIERADMPGFWQSVTGSRASLEETLFETAVREVFEETGIRIVEGDPSDLADNEVIRSSLQDWHMTNTYEIYPKWRYRYAPGVTHNTEYVFGLCLPHQMRVQLDPKEHLRYVWLPYLEAADTCFSSSNAEAILQIARRQ